MAMSENPVRVNLRYEVPPRWDEWIMPEGTVPEAHLHDLTARRLVELLDAWVQRTGLDAVVARNIAIRFLRERPRVGIDPDVCLVEPKPPSPRDFSSVKLWEPGRAPPRLAIEVVSRWHPNKDYERVQERYAYCGVEELWVLDPERFGPVRFGGPFPVQQWLRGDGILERCHAGEGPVYSPTLKAWLFAEPVRICDSRAGDGTWTTLAEEARAQADEARSQADEARSQADEARSQADEARSQADEARSQADEARSQAHEARSEAERERAARLAAEARLAELERKLGNK
jgi:Uma2 family endonuclease